MKKGFTLVEIMIIVVILAILAAIAIPPFMRARDRVQKEMALEEAKKKTTVIAEIGPLVQLERTESAQVSDEAEINLNANGITFSIDGRTVQISNKAFMIESFSMGGITLKSSPPSQDVTIKIKRR